MYKRQEQRDRAGRWVQFHRNHSGLVTKVVHHGGYQVLVIASGSRVAALDLATAEGPVRLATFDYRHGSLIAETPAGAGTTRYEVDEVDRISAWVDANDVRYRHHYDDRDRCVSQGTENAGHERVHRYAYTYSDGPLPGGQTMVVHYPNGANAVSYTHLDVYKRQVLKNCSTMASRCAVVLRRLSSR